MYYLAVPILVSTFIDSYNNGPLIINQQKDNDVGNDNILTISQYTEGMSFPTSMTFVDNNTILVLEKNNGTVRLVSNGILQQKPLLKLENINNKAERGMLGIAVLKKGGDNNTNTNDMDKDNPTTANTYKINYTS